MIPPITPSSCPPGIPPGTPPTTPPVIATGGGASSSLIIWTLDGILLGVRSRPFAILLVTFTTFAADGVDAAGGGGGGGGGGASRRVTNCCLGSTSVNHNGSKSRRPIRNNCKTNDRRVDHVLLLRCATLESSRVTSNRTLSGAAEARGPIVAGPERSFTAVSTLFSSSTTACVFMFPFRLRQCEARHREPSQSDLTPLVGLEPDLCCPLQWW